MFGVNPYTKFNENPLSRLEEEEGTCGGGSFYNYFL
jgi:hypothetical protein